MCSKRPREMENMLTQQVPFWAWSHSPGSWAAFWSSRLPHFLRGGNEWVDSDDLWALSSHWVSFHSGGLATLQPGDCSVGGGTRNQGNFQNTRPTVRIKHTLMLVWWNGTRQPKNTSGIVLILFVPATAVIIYLREIIIYWYKIIYKSSCYCKTRKNESNQQ